MTFWIMCCITWYRWYTGWCNLCRITWVIWIDYWSCSREVPITWAWYQWSDFRVCHGIINICWIGIQVSYGSCLRFISYRSWHHWANNGIKGRITICRCPGCCPSTTCNNFTSNVIDNDCSCEVDRISVLLGHYVSILINIANRLVDRLIIVGATWPLWSIWFVWIDWRSRCLWIRWIHWRQLMLQVNREILISCVIIVERQICWIAISNQLIPLFLIIGNATAGTIAGFWTRCSWDWVRL